MSRFEPWGRETWHSLHAAAQRHKRAPEHRPRETIEQRHRDHGLGSLPGAERGRHRVGDASYFVYRGGTGSPLLLLHGFPETHACWHRIAPRLADAHCIVAPDLRGYGSSEAPLGGPRGEGYTKREMAADLIALMAELGHDRFAVVGHDRGARVAYRLALDHPERVTRAGLLNVVPTIDQFERMGAGPSLGYWPWFLLAQPAPFPERVLLGDPGALLDHVFATWPSDPAAIDSERRRTYLRALTPSTAAAMCGDYRASFHLDGDHEAADRAAGHRIACPVLIVTGENEGQLADAPQIWNAWTDDLTAARVPGGHFSQACSPAGPRAFGSRSSYGTRPPASGSSGQGRTGTQGLQQNRLFHRLCADGTVHLSHRPHPRGGIMDVLDTEETFNVRTLVLPFALTMLVLVAAVHVVIAVEGNQVGLLENLLLAVVACYYAFYYITRRARLRRIRFGMLVTHATAYAIVNVSYLLHAFVLIVSTSPSIRGDSQFLMDQGWFGVTFGMATGWGIGLIVHAFASIASRGWEDHP